MRRVLRELPPWVFGLLCAGAAALVLFPLAAQGDAASPPVVAAAPATPPGTTYPDGRTVASTVDGGFVVAAPALPADDPVSDALALVKALSDSATPWTLKLGLALILVVGLLRKYAKRLPWGVGAFFGSTEGGSTLLLLLTFGASFGAALSAGKPLTWGLAVGTLGVALTAAGGWEVACKPLWARVLRPTLARVLPGLFPPAAPVSSP